MQRESFSSFYYSQKWENLQSKEVYPCERKIVDRLFAREDECLSRLTNRILYVLSKC